MVQDEAWLIAESNIAFGTLIAGFFPATVASSICVVTNRTSNTQPLGVLFLRSGWNLGAIVAKVLAREAHSISHLRGRPLKTRQLLSQLLNQSESEVVLVLGLHILHLVQEVALYFRQMNQMKDSPFPPFHSFAMETVICQILIKLINAFHMSVVLVHNLHFHLWLSSVRCSHSNPLCGVTCAQHENIFLVFEANTQHSILGAHHTLPFLQLHDFGVNVIWHALSPFDHSGYCHGVPFFQPVEQFWHGKETVHVDCVASP